MHLASKSLLSSKNIILIFSLSILSLFFSYPALSHDIYNYLFNAKMVVVYHQNPHIMTALDFPSDPWLKYMHNVHTPAPYGFGWTIISIIPYLIGFGHLQTTMLMFRLLMIIAFVISLSLYSRIDPKLKLNDLVPLMFNPLILIELIGNIHNDAIMMMLALWGIYLWRANLKFYSVVVLALSISIKYSTILLVVIPLVLFLMNKLFNRNYNHLWGSMASVIMALPLFTARSQRFLPWYLSWSLFFLPFIKIKCIKHFFIVASFAAIISYGLIIWYGNYTPQLLINRSIILFGIPIIYSAIQMLWFLTKKPIIYSS